MWFLQLLLGVALNIVAYLLAPKPPQQQPAEVKDLDDPVAEAGKPLPVVFGSIRVQGLNIMWFGDKETVQRTMEGSSGKK